MCSVKGDQSGRFVPCLVYRPAGAAPMAGMAPAGLVAEVSKRQAARLGERLAAFESRIAAAWRERNRPETAA